VPPDGILGPPSLQSSNRLSSLVLTRTPRRNGQTRLAVSSGLGKPTPPGKPALSQVPSHWVEGELDPLLRTSDEQSSTDQGLPQKRGRTTLITSVCMCE
jgi:hypothetical protein